MFYLKEAMDWADLHGGVTGQNIRRGMYQRQGWVPAGLEGVCLPATWTEDDHRGVTTVMVYRGRVKGDVDGPIDELIRRGIIGMERVYTVEIPRRPDWLGS
jgi:branched-chain amino acid transport system substrate-binding protein